VGEGSVFFYDRGTTRLGKEAGRLRWLRISQVTGEEEGRGIKKQVSVLKVSLPNKPMPRARSDFIRSHEKGGRCVGKRTQPHRKVVKRDADFQG